ncbi:MAG: hypothetical protein AB8G15_12985 [Saprospiraceae bacterium]
MLGKQRPYLQTTYFTANDMVRTMIVCLFFFLTLNDGFGQKKSCTEVISTDSMMHIDYWHSDVILKEGEKIKTYGKYHVDVTVKEISEGCTWKITIRNWADLPFLINSDGGRLLIICEAKSVLGIWKPIEYKRINWCLLDWDDFSLAPTAFLEITRPNIAANIKLKFDLNCGWEILCFIRMRLPLRSIRSNFSSQIGAEKKTSYSNFS